MPGLLGRGQGVITGAAIWEGRGGKEKVEVEVEKLQCG